MMIEQKLEQKLESYLKDNNHQYYEGSVSYSGLREMKMIDDGKLRRLHLVNFTVSISEQIYDGDGHYLAAFDEKTHELIYIVGPQSYERIND